MNPTTLMHNMAQIDTFKEIAMPSKHSDGLIVEAEKTAAQKKLASGFLALGVKGDRLVIVDYGSNIFTALIAGIKRIFAGISLDTKAVGKVFVETEKLRMAMRQQQAQDKTQAEFDASVKGKVYNFVVGIYNLIPNLRSAPIGVGGLVTDKDSVKTT